MTTEERARLLESAAHCLSAAAHMLLVPAISDEPESPQIGEMVKRGRELAEFAAEMGPTVSKPVGISYEDYKAEHSEQLGKSPQPEPLCQSRFKAPVADGGIYQCDLNAGHDGFHQNLGGSGSGRGRCVLPWDDGMAIKGSVEFCPHTTSIIGDTARKRCERLKGHGGAHQAHTDDGRIWQWSADHAGL